MDVYLRMRVITTGKAKKNICVFRVFPTDPNLFFGVFGRDV